MNNNIYIYSLVLVFIPKMGSNVTYAVRRVVIIYFLCKKFALSSCIVLSSYVIWCAAFSTAVLLVSDLHCVSSNSILRSPHQTFHITHWAVWFITWRLTTTPPYPLPLLQCEMYKTQIFQMIWEGVYNTILGQIKCYGHRYCKIILKNRFTSESTFFVS